MSHRKSNQLATMASVLNVLSLSALLVLGAIIPTVSCMVLPKNPQTRRSFIPTAGAAISSLCLIGGTTADQAFAAGTTDDGKLIPPANPIPMGGAVPLRPVFQEQAEASPWQTPQLLTKLGQSRIATAQELSPLSPSLSPFAEMDVFYPSSFAGEWNVRATLRRKTYPYGLNFVPSRSLVEGSPRYRSEQAGDTTSYQARYISLDGAGTSKIIADRRFNSISATKAYNQLTPVQEVLWDPKKDPTTLKFQFAPGMLTEDMMPIGQRRAEVYITARKKEEDSANHAFAASERTRQVTLGAGAVVVSDTETITEFQIVDDGGNSMRAVQRIAVYLTPNPNSREGILWQQVGGKAVAFFDYDLEMQKV